MAIRDLLPRRFNRDKRNVPVRREEYSDPFMALQREMNRMFDNFFEDFGLTRWDETSSGFYPQIDVKETDKEFQVIAELPGLDEKDIDISLSDDVLILRGEKRLEKEEKESNFYRMERSYGAFHRAIPLPAEVDTQHVEAVYKKGVLTVHLPKKPEAQRKVKKIAVQAS